MATIQNLWPVVIVVMIMAPSTLFLQRVIESSSELQITLLNQVRTDLSKMGNNTFQEPYIPTNPTTGTALTISNTDKAAKEAAKCVAAKGNKQCWRELKRAAWLTGLDELEKIPEPELARFRHPNRNWEAFDILTPTHDCDLNHFGRLGAEGDGGKWVCGPLAVDDSCVLFSLGSAGNFKFEEAMHNFTKGRCKIFTFDCSGLWTNPSTTFYPWCISDRDYTHSNGQIFKRIATIFEELKLTQITHLKMDIEGFEWRVFDDILNTENKLALPKQISFELHVENDKAIWSPAELGPTSNWAYPIIRLGRMFDKHGYRIAAQENNIYCAHCAEYIIMREDNV